ncbi:MAG: hypothetical protein LBP76_01210 [Treponema sp.]|jgi:hypothetical protein|nr:hypothetical protein [Treponema sp.]
MKKMVLWFGVLLLAVNGIVFGQELPRLAGVEFSTNVSTEKIKADSLTVRNLVESQMVATGKYQIITRAEIDHLLANQGIQVSKYFKRGKREKNCNCRTSATLLPDRWTRWVRTTR